MAKLVRHRQPKGPVTDRPSLKPPRHISTLQMPAGRGDGVGMAERTDRAWRRGGDVLAAPLRVTLSVMTCAERCPDLRGNESTEFFPARDSANPRGRSNNRRIALSRWASAQVCEVMDPRPRPTSRRRSRSATKYRPNSRPSLSFSRRDYQLSAALPRRSEDHRLGCARAIVMGAPPQLDRQAFTKLAWCVDVAIRVPVLAALLIACVEEDFSPA